MPEAVAVDGPPARRRAATVSASALARNLDCSVHRQARSRRRDPATRRRLPTRPVPRCLPAILAARAAVKTATPQLKLMEKTRELVRRANVDALTACHRWSNRPDDVGPPKGVFW
jgi:hypothetical protein